MPSVVIDASAGAEIVAARGCLLTTRAAKWATRQVGGDRTVSEVAGELVHEQGLVGELSSQTIDACWPSWPT